MQIKSGLVRHGFERIGLFTSTNPGNTEEEVNGVCEHRRFGLWMCKVGSVSDVMSIGCLFELEPKQKIPN